MTFSIDANIIIAVANKYDSLHIKSNALLTTRNDDLFLPISIMHEASETFVTKFNKVVDNILIIIKATEHSSNFYNDFTTEYLNLIALEQKNKKNIVNFYNYIYSLIEEDIKNKLITKVLTFLVNYPLDLISIIPEKLEKVKKIKEFIVLDDDMREFKDELDMAVRTQAYHPIRHWDNNHFLTLCAYCKDLCLDYFTADRRYFLDMTSCLNKIIKPRFGLECARVTPQFLI